MTRRRKPIALGAALLLFLCFSLVVMLLWNALLPSLFGIAALSYWQAMGLLLLCRILFGGLGVGLMGMAGMRRAHMHHEKRMARHWHAMSEQEREEFIQRRHPHFFRHVHEMCGHGPGRRHAEQADGCKRHAHGRPDQAENEAGRE